MDTTSDCLVTNYGTEKKEMISTFRTKGPQKISTVIVSLSREFHPKHFTNKRDLFDQKYKSSTEKYLIESPNLNRPSCQLVDVPGDPVTRENLKIIATKKKQMAVFHFLPDQQMKVKHSFFCNRPKSVHIDSLGFP